MSSVLTHIDEGKGRGVRTFGLDGERHVVSRVESPPEESEPLVGVDLLLSGLVLQRLSVTWQVSTVTRAPPLNEDAAGRYVCVCVVTPEELADWMSCFGQTSKQRLFPMGVRRFGDLELWEMTSVIP